jgi:hypothetical protein
MLWSMRVIGRVLLGTLAIVFAMVFIARLVQRRRPHGRRHAHRVEPRAIQAITAPSSQHVGARTYLAAQPGGSGWGRLVVPPSSRSRTLRRNGRRRTRRLPSYAAQRRRFSGKPALRLQKTVRAMTYAMLESTARTQHAANEGATFTGGLPSRLRTGASRRWRRIEAGCRSAAAGAGVAAPDAGGEALALRRA